MPAPVYPLAMPAAPGFSRVSWRLKRATAMTQSPLTGFQQVQQRDYALWEAELTLPPMNAEQAGQWAAFITRLHGRAGTFLLGNPNRKLPAGKIDRNGLAQAPAALGAYDISVTVGPAATGGLKAGDYMQIGAGNTAKLHQVVADAVPNAGGTLSLTIEPRLRAAVATASPITFLRPQGVFRMTSDRIAWDADRAARFGLSFACMEAA